MAQRITVWHGTEEDLMALRVIVQRYCECVEAEYVCGVHEMLTDQTVIDHLAFVGVNRKRYWHGEFDPLVEFF